MEMVSNTSQQIRDYVRREYIEPARQRKQARITVVVGDVHKAIHLTNRVPSVCQALRGKKFLAENHLVIEKYEGPKSGLGTTVTVTYRLTDTPCAQPAPSLPFPFLRFRGIAKEVFQSLGGGEQFIKNEREHFYGDKE